LPGNLSISHRDTELTEKSIQELRVLRVEMIFVTPTQHPGPPTSAVFALVGVVYAALGASPEGAGSVMDDGLGGAGAGVLTGVFSTSFRTRSDNCAPFDVQ